MSVGLPSDEVAEDYKSSLEDLIDNSRLVINNLTVIAKENIEHASAISRVLENHIKTTPPNRKLPALYLLDSIVKNVGTPYTLFLSRNLYSTFMNAYSLVNTLIRQKLDEMLQTWKLPNPGSLETKPVFPPEVTRPIEDALHKARSAAFEQQQRQALRARQDALARSRPVQQMGPGYAQPPTPTPPPMIGQYRPPLQQYPVSYPPQPTPNGPYQQIPNGNPFPTPPPFISGPLPAPQPPKTYQQPPPPIDLPQLHKDIEELVRAAQGECAANPFDSAVKGRLNALLSLQSLLHQQYHPPDQLQQVRDQVTQLQKAHQASQATSLSVNSSYAPPISHSPIPILQSTPQSLSSHQPAQQPTVPSPVDIQALMSSKNLANIIAKAQKSTSTPEPSLSQLVSSTPTQDSTNNGASDLIASLTKAGLLTGSSTSTPQAFTYGTPPVPNVNAAIAPVNDVQLTSASLKIPRLNLISLLYESQPNQCTTCGRRFQATEEGREKRRRHYDWHFRTNQRISEAAKRAQNRSWYVDELEWIRSRDDPEGNPVDISPSTGGKDKAGPSSSTVQPFVLVPSGQSLANQPCPICQEKFVASFNDEVSDWVWMDAVQVGSRIYHASCHSEIKKNQSRENTPARTDTPDSVLGKRKALEMLNDMDTKLIKV